MRLLKFFLLSPLWIRGEGVQKIAENIHYLKRDAFVDDPLHFWLKLIHMILFLYHNLQFRLPVLPLSGAVLQKKCAYKFSKIHKKTPKKRFQHRCFVVNSGKFLIISFLKNPSGRLLQQKHSFCLQSHHDLFAFSKTMSHIFSGWVFFRFNL